MDRAFGILVINACYRASRELGEMGVMMEEFVEGEDGRAIKMQAGSAISEIGKIAETIYKHHPDLEKYVEEQIEKYGRVS